MAIPKKHSLLNSRYQQMIDYPGATKKAGDIIEGEVTNEAVSGRLINMCMYPKLFRELKWYEERLSDFNTLFDIKFCRIIKTHGYWKDGDILPVQGYKVSTDKSVPTFHGFYLRGYNKYGEYYEYDRIQPATEEEWLKHKEENKLSITAPSTIISHEG